jgi:hypothetical protein
VVKVGNNGDKGRVEIQDILVSTKGATAGAVLIEWNIEAEAAGAAGMWGMSPVPLLPLPLMLVR